jgi:hypothetical protein
MQDDQAAQDAALLLASLATNHPEAMRGTAFTLSEDETRRVGLNRDRFDNAMWWLIEYGFVERDEEAENLQQVSQQVSRWAVPGVLEETAGVCGADRR